MKIAHDLFAETNPAFGTFAAVAFCRKYKETSGKDAALALLFLAIPIAISDDLALSFSETTATTGLLSWLNRYPAVRVDLGDRLDASKEIVSETVRFALACGALRLDRSALISLGDGAPKAGPIEKLPDGPKRAIKRAERLGGWMARAGSAGTIFSAFGVVP